MKESNKQKNDKASELLFEMIADLKSAEEVRLFLDDLCTFHEVEQFSQRMDCARLLLEGETYNEIISKTEISSTTLSRISRCLQHGSGGYSELLANFLQKRGLLGKENI